MRTGRSVAVLLVCLLGLEVAGACTSTTRTGPKAPLATTTTTGQAVPAPAPSAPVYAAPGPFSVGVVTLPMGETMVDVWYPAERGTETGKQAATYEIADWLPPALKAKVPLGTAKFTTAAYPGLPASGKGPFPLVLFSHGFDGYRDQSTFLTTHLASWGFVVAAPDFLSRGLASVFNVKPAVPMSDNAVLRSTVDLLKAQNAQPGGPLGGRVDATKLAVVGHSAGGFDAITFGAEPDVATYVALAAGVDPSAGNDTVLAKKPSLYMAGADDAVFLLDTANTGYAAAPAPKRLVTIGKSGHLVFSDICLIGSGQGGVVALAQSLGIPVPLTLKKLATDGCESTALPVTKAYPVIDHFVVAHLRSVFGIDAHPVGLDDSVANAFAPAAVTYRHAP